jgi:hypothetical protein
MKMGTVLSFPNFAGLACEFVLVIGILYSNNVIGEGNPLVSFANLWAFIFFRLPKKLFGSKDETVTPSTKGKTDSSKKKKKE